MARRKRSTLPLEADDWIVIWTLPSGTVLILLEDGTYAERGTRATGRARQRRFSREAAEAFISRDRKLAAQREMF